MARTWGGLEDWVRILSSFRWGNKAVEQIIAGNKIDCVVEKEADYFVLVEVTLEDTLDKVRKDTTKLVLAKSALLAKNIYAKCYIVIDGNITQGMRQAGKENNIDVLTIEEFERDYYDFKQYATFREKKSFGSCIDPETGKIENTRYIPVNYILTQYNKDIKPLATKDIVTLNLVDAVIQNKRVILTGEFGSGKSRCLKEVYSELANMASRIKKYPLAINLREHWGAKTGGEIIRRHFEELGLSNSADSIIKAYRGDSIIFLLDGFDEIATHVWSDEEGKLESVRHESLAGVRDLIMTCGGGVIVAGREHYFNSNSELVRAFGIKSEDTLFVKCNSEFTEEEYVEFIKDHTDDITIPLWLPKRPLICSLILKLEQKQIDELFQDVDNEVRFWHTFIRIVCTRESLIKDSFDPDTIKKILVRLSRLTRTKPANVGPISLSEIKSVFEEVLGKYPIEQAAVMLQRLPGLGRHESQSSDRNFMDVFILDGLRALDTIDIVSSGSKTITQEKWINPLQVLGLSIVANTLQSTDSVGKCVGFLKSNANSANFVLLGDIMSSILLTNTRAVDFQNFELSNGNLALIDLSDKEVKSAVIRTSGIDKLVLNNFKATSFIISDSHIGTLEGVTSKQGLPTWIQKCDIDAFSSVKTIAAIKRSDLSLPHKIFVAIIKKTFFQPGKGRKEEALLRGMGQVDDKGYSDKILKLLVREDILKVVPGDDGRIFVPIRKQTARMEKLLSELTLSSDPIWQTIGSL